MADVDSSCPVVVVSMANATARRKAFSARAQRAKVPWRFFNACTSICDDLVYDAELAERNKGRQLTPGEIGCYSSHYSVWQEMMLRGIPQCIVLEDDTIVDWAFLSALAAVDLAALNMPYLRLYAKQPAFCRTVERNFLQHSRSVVEYVGHAYGTQGYAITQSGAKAFSEACATIQRPIDDQMDRSWEHGIRNLAVFPAPVIEEFVESGIGATRFQSDKSPAFNSPRQRISRWIDRQKIRAMKLSLLSGG